MSNILLVDDDRHILQQLSSLIQSFGHVTTSTIYPDNLFQILDAESMDLILLDIYMPDTDGLTLLTQLKNHANYGSLPVIILTADPDDQLMEACLNMGAVDYIKKPSNATVLKARIQSALNTHGTIQNLITELRHKNQQLEREIEEQKRMEREMEQQKVLSMRSDRLRSLGEMAAGIAHELNQPLVGVRGLAEHLLIGMDRNWKLSPEKVREKLQLIIDQADRMSHIIEHVRIFAREAGKPETHSVKINAVIRSCVEILGTQMSTHGIRLQYDLAERLPEVQVNRYSMEEVLLNLMVNARDAVEARLATGEETYVPSILLRSLFTNQGLLPCVQIFVRDNGVGIPGNIIPRVFDPFFTTKAPDKGTGLGLSICKSIVEEYEGTIEVQSNLETGTVVIISLPCVNSESGAGYDKNSSGG
ncbi:response regulator [Deltaproteobacteria bacterium TL4]